MAPNRPVSLPRSCFQSHHLDCAPVPVFGGSLAKTTGTVDLLDPQVVGIEADAPRSRPSQGAEVSPVRAARVTIDRASGTEAPSDKWEHQTRLVSVIRRLIVATGLAITVLMSAWITAAADVPFSLGTAHRNLTYCNSHQLDSTFLALLRLARFRSRCTSTVEVSPPATSRTSIQLSSMHWLQRAMPSSA